MAGSAFEVDVTLVDGHLPLVPGLGSLTAGGSPAADSEVLIGHADGTGDLDSLSLGVGDKLVGDLLHGRETVAGEGDPGALDFLVFETLLLVLVSHIY